MAVEWKKSNISPMPGAIVELKLDDYVSPDKYRFVSRGTWARMDGSVICPRFTHWRHAA